MPVFKHAAGDEPDVVFLVGRFCWRFKGTAMIFFRERILVFQPWQNLFPRDTRLNKTNSAVEAESNIPSQQNDLTVLLIAGPQV